MAPKLIKTRFGEKGAKRVQQLRQNMGITTPDVVPKNKIKQKSNMNNLISKQVIFMQTYLKTYVEIIVNSLVFSTFPAGRML